MDFTSSIFLCHQEKPFLMSQHIWVLRMTTCRLSRPILKCRTKPTSSRYRVLIIFQIIKNLISFVEIGNCSYCSLKNSMFKCLTCVFVCLINYSVGKIRLLYFDINCHSLHLDQAALPPQNSHLTFDILFSLLIAT